MKLKILYRKNLKMSVGKIAAQCVHAACMIKADAHMPVVVLGVSDAKFNAHRATALSLVADAGLTEVSPGTETCLAFYEPNGMDEGRRTQKIETTTEAL